jgi:hypothetical protein
MRCARPFDDGGLADTRLADQDGVVLAPALQHLDGTPDLVVAADDGVELALACPLREVERVLLERLALPFRFGRVDALPTAHGFERRLERLPREPCVARERAGRPLAVGECEQEHLAGDEGIAAPARFLLGGLQERVELAADLDAVAALHLLARGRWTRRASSRTGRCRRRRAAAAPSGRRPARAWRRRGARARCTGGRA